MEDKAKLFLLKNKENGDFNQYWYSKKTIQFLANQAINSDRCCFLSTPSIYYAIDNPNHEKPLFLFDVRSLRCSLIRNSQRKIPIIFSMTSANPKIFPKNIITTLILCWQIHHSSRTMSGRSTQKQLERSSRKTSRETLLEGSCSALSNKTNHF